MTAAQRWIYKVASYSISPSCYYTENCLCHKQLMDEGGMVYEPRLPLLFYLLCDLYFVEMLHASPSMADSCSVANSFVFLVLVSLLPCTHRFFLKFFLKCNQNCLKNAGNPRDMRRFQVRCGCRRALRHVLCHGHSPCFPTSRKCLSGLFCKSVRHAGASCH